MSGRHLRLYQQVLATIAMSTKNKFQGLEAFSEFPIPTYEQWREVTEKSLKGASFEKKLLTATYEGITLQPMYRQEDMKDLQINDSLPGQAPFIRGTDASPQKSWEVCQEINVSTPAKFNEAARHDLSKGQTALNIVLDRNTQAGKNANETSELTGQAGLSISSYEHVRRALDGIDLSDVPIHVYAGAVSAPILAFVSAYVQEREGDLTSLTGCIGMDPLGEAVQQGQLFYSLTDCYDYMAEAVEWASESTPELQTVLVQGHIYQGGGSSTVEELAFSLATAVEYLQALSKRGVSIDKAAKSIRFSFSIGADVFMETAKFRAARMLWSRIVEAFGGSEDAQKMYIHARTSSWTKTVYDPYVNILRGTAEAFAGATGGVNSMHVSPFDEPIQKATSFSRRIARHTQLILQEEAHLAVTVDPGGGSWYIEVVTDKLAKKVWEVFQKIEADGGMLTALENGKPQEQVANVAKERFKRLEQRKDVFVGINQYANISEKPVEMIPEDDRLSINEHIKTVKNQGVTGLQASEQVTIDSIIAAVRSGATIGEVTKALGRTDEPTLTIKPVPQQRGAEKFERLRKTSADYLKKTGQRPYVFLASLGAIPSHKARSEFATSFFEVGGFDVVKSDGYHSVDEASQAALDSQATIVVICGTDDSYQEMVVPLTEKIKQAKPEVTVLVAGKPATEVERTFTQAGVSDYIHLQSNCYEVLVQLQKEKGVISDE